MATDKPQRLRWAATSVIEIAYGGFQSPPDLDNTSPVNFKMYAAMGGIPLQKAGSSEDAAMTGMDMPDMPGMPGMNAGSGHAGHAGHSGGQAAGHSGAEPATWIATLNWLCTIGFTVAAVFWLYRFITARLKPSEDGSHQSVGILCQLAMAAGMAIMFGVML